MRHWPWFTICVAIGLAASSPGRSMIHAAFFSNEQLSRNIAQPSMYGAIAAVVILAAAEWWVKRWIDRRKAET